MERISPARIRHELDRILQEATPEKMLARLDQLGVLAHLHPEMHVDEWVVQRFAAHMSITFEPTKRASLC